MSSKKMIHVYVRRLSFWMVLANIPLFSKRVVVFAQSSSRCAEVGLKLFPRVTLKEWKNTLSDIQTQRLFWPNELSDQARLITDAWMSDFLVKKEGGSAVLETAFFQFVRKCIVTQCVQALVLSELVLLKAKEDQDRESCILALCPIMSDMMARYFEHKKASVRVLCSSEWLSVAVSGIGVFLIKAFLYAIILIARIFSQQGRERRAAVGITITGSGIYFDKTKRTGCQFVNAEAFKGLLDRAIFVYRRKDVLLGRQFKSRMHKNKVIVETLAGSYKLTKVVDLARYIDGDTLKSLWKQLASMRGCGKEASIINAYFIRFVWQYLVNAGIVYKYNMKLYLDYEYSRPDMIPLKAALNGNKGLLVCYQLSNLDYALINHATCADAFFQFSNYYDNMFKNMSSEVATRFNVGYINDYAFAGTAEKALALRGRLRKFGVEYVISYFDENSSDATFSLIPNKRAASIYLQLLTYMITHENIGLILAPKKPGTLGVRCPDVSPLIRKAEETGRCICRAGETVTEEYPCESAQASDLSIALLIGGTAGLESFLAGTQCVYLDLECLADSYGLQRFVNKFIFQDLECFISKLEKHISGELDFFADSRLWDDFMCAKDAFRDGKSIERIATICSDIIACYDKNFPAEKILTSVKLKHSRQGSGQFKVCDV